MIICITAAGSTLDSNIDPRFGRSPYFIFFDTETGNMEAVENPHSQFSGGAGIQSAQLMVQKGVKAVLTGHVGPNAFDVLTPAGIDIRLGISGTVERTVELFKSGQLPKADSPGPGKQSGAGPRGREGQKWRRHRQQ
ncbi:MAG TPA: NifB/NifX family molybdenum-iron cluster-binding protein [Candidatus Omnitrophota bacterium]|nr:NifB/NifX family molybdenum-iron cluster-binding protein [Candidatus Omnitrophota bacterium]